MIEPDYADQDVIHETEDDVRRERAALELVCFLKNNLTFVPASSLAPYDAIFVRNGKMVAIGEVKCRDHAFGFYPDYTVDAAKVERIREAARKMKLQAVLIVQWTDRLKYVVLHPGNAEWWGVTGQKRRDRDEFTDAVYHIPLSSFKEL